MAKIFNIGDIVKAIDNEYGITNARNKCEGVVVDTDLSSEKITIRVTKLANGLVSHVGETFDVSAGHFEKIGSSGETVHKLKVKEVGVNLEEATVGDFLLLKNGEAVLICYDYDFDDYRGLSLDRGVITQFDSSIGDLIETIEDSWGKVERVVKANKVEIREL